MYLYRGTYTVYCAVCGVRCALGVRLTLIVEHVGHNSDDGADDNEAPVESVLPDGSLLVLLTGGWGHNVGMSDRLSGDLRASRCWWRLIDGN